METKKPKKPLSECFDEIVALLVARDMDNRMAYNLTLEFFAMIFLRNHIGLPNFSKTPFTITVQRQ